MTDSGEYSLEAKSGKDLERSVTRIDEKDALERMQANLRGETTIMSIMEGISPEDILYSNFTSSQHTFGKLPNHYLVVDHEHQNLVLAFRGTFSLSEAITDVNCAPEPFYVGGEDGFALIVKNAMSNGVRCVVAAMLAQTKRLTERHTST